MNEERSTDLKDTNEPPVQPRKEQSRKEREEELEKKEAERKAQALIHKLSERADSNGRKAQDRARRQITDHVAELNVDRARAAEEVWAIYRAAVKDRNDTAKKAMREIQETLNAALNEATSFRDQNLTTINAEFKKQTDGQETELDMAIMSISEDVGEFQAAILALDIEQLQELMTKGVVEVSDKVVIQVPGHIP